MRLLADFLDARDQLLIAKYGHGKIDRVVAYQRIGVLDKQIVRLPLDSEVIGVKVYLGEIHLKVLVGTSAHLIERIFYAFDNGQYMSNPRLGYIDSLRVGDNLWHVFEDDLAWHYGVR